MNKSLFVEGPYAEHNPRTAVLAAALRDIAMELLLALSGPVYMYFCA